MEAREAEPKVDGRKARHAGRQEALLGAVVDYVAEHGIADLSIRPLAAGVGVSHRTLLHHFGSKENLLIQIAREARRRQRVRLSEQAEALEEIAPHELPTEAWRRVGGPDSAPLFLQFFELYAQALQHPRRYESFLDDVVSDWLDAFMAPLIRDGLEHQRAETLATLMLATFRGLMLDALATGDWERADRAVALFADTLSRTELRDAPAAAARATRRSAHRA